MREEDLHRLLTDASADVQPSHPAVTGWERARRTRRTRRAAAAVALTVTLLTGGTGLALRSPDAATPPAGPTAAPTASAPAVQQPPAELRHPGDPLGRLTDPAGAPLSTRPVRRALALYQPVDRASGEAGRIRVLGDDGIVRELDVVTPAPTRDAEGNAAVPLKTGSLSPDGRTAAFAQTDEVIVVDLTSAAVRRFPLDGYLEHVLWAGDRLLVGDEDRTYEVDRRTGVARQLPVPPWDVVTPDPTAPAGSLTVLGGPAGNLTLSNSTDDGKGWDRRPVHTARLPSAHRIDEFYGRGRQRGDLIARAAWITTGQVQGAEGVATLDARTGAVTHLLDLGTDHWKGCCEVLGWDRDGAVLLRHSPGELWRWQPRTGEVTGVTTNLYGEVSLAG